MGFDPLLMGILSTTTGLSKPCSIDVSEEIEQVANEFSGTVYDDDVDKLKQCLGKALGRVLRRIETIVNQQVKAFQVTLASNAKTLSDTMIQSALTELETLKREINNRETEVATYEQCLVTSETYRQRVMKSLS